MADRPDSRPGAHTGGSMHQGAMPAMHRDSHANMPMPAAQMQAMMTPPKRGKG